MCNVRLHWVKRKALGPVTVYCKMRCFFNIIFFNNKILYGIASRYVPLLNAGL